MFKDEGKIWLYLIGIVILMGLYVFTMRQVLFPFFNGDPILDDIGADKQPPAILNPGQDYLASLNTNYGPILIDLYERNAPVNVNNFVYLSSKGYYNGTSFHRLVPKLLIQGGDRNTLNDDPIDDGKGNPGYLINDEINWDSLGLSDERKEELADDGYSSDSDIVSVGFKKYTVAMANTEADTNGSQFFIMFADEGSPVYDEFNGKFTVIGEVIGDKSAIGAISIVELLSENPTKALDIITNEYRTATPIIIESVTIYNQ
ncbi:MAG: peptidylprolyl isomerase [Candidatus Dojkabacteria bacterium]|nr:peptidylprolyl isomerase [Candidatus Dojkabacteria bacterium]